jgi:conjugal transfer pilus assembly protein TraF
MSSRAPARGRSAALAIAVALCLGDGAFDTALANPDNVEPAPQERFFERHGEGWFWYENRSPAQAPPEEPKTAPASPSTAKAEDPPPLSAEWLRINLPKYLDHAIDEPTPENVRAYYYLNRVWLDKGNKFSDVAQEVVTQDAFLDETTRRPLATYAANEMNRQAGLARADALQEIARQAGIYFFFHSQCRYCAVQAPILKTFAEAYGFAVIPVSLDGQPLPDGLYPDYRVDNGQAQRLGVEQTPAMFLVRPPDRVVLLAQGALAFAELAERVTMAGRQLGLIDDDRFDRTRPIQPVPSTAEIRLDRDAALTPEKLVEQIRKNARVR